MGPVAEFGMGMGLAGVAGIRARFPLLIIGLLTRFADQSFTSESFKFLGSSWVLLLIAFLVVLDFFGEMSAEGVMGYGLMKLVIRAMAGGLVFAAVFEGFSPVLGIVVGAGIAIVSYLVDQRLTPFLRTVDSPISSRHFHELLAFLTTVVIVLLPLMGYVIWAILIVLVVRNRDWYLQDNKRYRNLR